MNNPPDYDIVIVGAGITGLSLACSLINKGLRIAILDKYNFANPLGFEQCDLRVSAITKGSQQIFEKCQVWDKLAKANLSSFERMEVWEQKSATRLFFDAAETNQAYLGTIVKNYDLQTALILQAKIANELDWFCPESLKSIQHHTTHYSLIFTSGASITTELLVGADGNHSTVRQLAEIQNKVYDYQQGAIVATVHTEKKHQQTARQIFLPTGPLAFLPLANSRHCSIVWSTTPEEVERLKALSNELFCRELGNAFEHHLGKVESTSMRLSFPLKAQQCEQYIKPGIALIGDAAHSIHPLAGQGANLGIADAVCLATVILEAKRKQRTIGALHTLRRYERERRFHHCLMGGGIDLIKQVFATKNPFFTNARHFGLNLIEKAPWLKNYFMQYAMGNPSIDPLSTF